MNNKINNIRIKGFRRLADVYLEITPFMVLIGANGVGKTSLLDAFSLVSASASGTLNSIVSQMGGLGSILTRGKSNELSLTVDMDVPNHAPLQYEVHLESYGTGYSISKEVLCQSREGYPNPFKHINSNGTTIRYYDTEKNQLISPNWEYNPQETEIHPP